MRWELRCAERCDGAEGPPLTGPVLFTEQQQAPCGARASLNAELKALQLSSLKLSDISAAPGDMAPSSAATAWRCLRRSSGHSALASPLLRAAGISLRWSASLAAPSFLSVSAPSLLGQLSVRRRWLLSCLLRDQPSHLFRELADRPLAPGSSASE